jgi:hypothetical protein
VSVAEVYSRFATFEARQGSPTYEQWAAGIADDQELISRIAALPSDKQQPNLVFAAARFLGADATGYTEFRGWLLEHWSDVRAEVRRRYTQTNEPRRCSALLPVLAALPQPVALIEVGASAGLCLYPDRYSYTYDAGRSLDPAAGPSGVAIDCWTNGRVPIPSALPQVAWRAGIDLNPLDVTSEADMNWLRALVWPEQHDRRERLDAAIGIALEDPPPVLAGDLTTSLRDLAVEAPVDATLVVFHSAVLTYLQPTDREVFVDTVRSLPGHWLSNEAPGVFSFLSRPTPAPPLPATARFLLELDAEPLAWAGPHGQTLEWIA